MKIEQIVKLLKANKHYIPHNKEINISHASASDMMSDVLAYMKGGSNILLITGLLTPQVIRTSTLMDISAVVFTRGKNPSQTIINDAKKNQIAVLSTKLTTYTTCGLLFSSGLKSVDGYSFEGGD
jgi:predicted transcriptional regulator